MNFCKRKMSRLLAVILALMTTVCMFPGAVFASATDGKAEISIGAPVEAPAEGYSPGDTFTVPVYIADNPGFTIAYLNFIYDTDIIEPAGSTRNQATVFDGIISPTVFPAWTVSFSAVDSEQGDTLSIGLTNQLLIIGDEDAIEANGDSRDFVKNGMLYQVKFKVKNGASGGTYNIGIRNRLDTPKNFLNWQAQIVPVHFTGTTFKVAGDEVANKKALKEAIAEADALVSGYYTAMTWEPFAAAVAAAKAVAANADATQDEVNAALEQLLAKKTALADVMLPVYVKENGAADTAKILVKNYTMTELSKLVDSRDPVSASHTKNNVWTVISSNNYVTVDDLFLDAGLSAEWKSGASLIFTGSGGFRPTNQPTFDGLADSWFYPELTVSQAASTASKKTYVPLVVALTMSTTTVGNYDTTTTQQAEARNMTNLTFENSPRNLYGVTEAQAQSFNADGNRYASGLTEIILVKAPAGADKIALTAAIAAAELVSEADYTPVSWTPFAEALAGAKIVAANKAATQAQVDTAKDFLIAKQNALDALPLAGIDISWYNTADKYFEISTVAQLKGFAAITTPKRGLFDEDMIAGQSYPSRAGDTIYFDNFKGKTVKLTADLKLNGEGWYPISDINVYSASAGGQGASTSGTYSKVSWQGTFDGGGHVVSDFTATRDPLLTNNYGGYQGFFSGIGIDGVIKNLGIQGTLYGRVVGGIVGCSSPNTIKANVPSEQWPRIVNCFADVQITGNGSGTRFSGGIFGGEDSARAVCHVINCYVKGSVSNGQSAGGVVGVTVGDVIGCYNLAEVPAAVGNRGAVVASIYLATGRYENNFALSGTCTNLYRYYPSGATSNPVAVTEGFSSASELKGAAALSGLGGSYVADTEAVNDGYPILFWQAADFDGDFSSEVLSISATPPARLLYTEGESFDPAGFSATAYYADGTLQPVDAKGISWDKKAALSVSDTSVTFTVTHGGFTQTFPYDLSVNPAGLTSLALKANKTSSTAANPGYFYGNVRTIYANGETFDKASLGITGTFSDGKTRGLLQDELSVSPETLTAGVTEVTVTGTVDGVARTMSYPVTVLASPVPTLEGGVYQLATADDLVWFANKVNGQSLYQAAHTASAPVNTVNVSAKLLSDIDLTGSAFAPIGNGAALYPRFAGTFAGNGKAVTLSLKRTAQYTGLFGYVASSGIVRNLTVKGSVVSTQNYTGGIVAYSEGTLEAVRNQAVVTGTMYVGGIVGAVRGYPAATDGYVGAIKNAENTAAVTGTSNTGGIVGSAGNSVTVENAENTGTVNSAADAGGIVGNIAGGSVTNSSNSANVTSTGASGQAGGIAGTAATNGSVKNSITGCKNSGTVLSVLNGAGGIAGSAVSIEIVDSHNSGDVTGAKNIGGILGNMGNAAMILAASNSGVVTSTVADAVVVGSSAGTGGIAGVAVSSGGRVEACWNTGAVVSANSAAGGIIGRGAATSSSQKLVVVNCYNRGDVRSANTLNPVAAAGGIAGVVSGLYASVSNVYSTGKVEADAAELENVSGAIGKLAEAQAPVRNLYFLAGSAEKDNSSGMAKTEESMKTVDFKNEVSGTGRGFVMDKSGNESINDGYPILAGVQTEDAGLPEEILIIAPPARLSYIEGETFDKTGFAARVRFSDGTYDQVTDITANVTAVGLQTAEVELTAAYEGTDSLKKTYSLTVTPNAVDVLSFYAYPIKLAYVAGEAMSTDGLRMSVKYTNGTSNTNLAAANYTVNPLNGTILSQDDTLLTITYEYGGNVTTLTCPLLVAPAGSEPETIDANNDSIKDTVLLKSANDVLWFSSQNASGTKTNWNVRVENDIDLSGVFFRSITGYDGGASGGVVFDGQGHTITLDTSDTGTGGLFDTVGKTTANTLWVTIKNLTIDGTVVRTSASYTGAIANQAIGTKLESCTNLASVTSGGNNVGGIAGLLRFSNGKTDASPQGLYLVNKGVVKGVGQGVGGVIGTLAFSVALADISNYGSVTSTDIVGGIVGDAADSYFGITNAYNEGAVTASGAYDSLSSLRVAGGIAGSGPQGLITNSVNVGDVSSPVGYVGGIVGLAAGSIENSYNWGTIRSTATVPSPVPFYVGGIAGYSSTAASAIKNAYNAGGVEASKGSTLKGGVAASYAGTVANSYYLDSSVAGGSAIGAAKTSSELKALAPTLGDAFKVSVNDGYPLLAWQGEEAAPTVLTIKGGVSDIELKLAQLKAHETTIDSWTNRGNALTNVKGILVSDLIKYFALDDQKIEKFQFAASGFTGTECAVSQDAILAWSWERNGTAEMGLQGIIKDGKDGKDWVGNVTTLNVVYKVEQNTEVDIRWYTAAPSAEAFTLSTMAELKGLAALVNGTAPASAQGQASGAISPLGVETLPANDFTGKTITLSSDIDLADELWEPIGGADVGTKWTWKNTNAAGSPSSADLLNVVANGNAKPFNGEFDGAGFAIKGLMIEKQGDAIGFIGYLGADGYVHDLTINGKLTSTGAGNAIGGLVGYNKGKIAHYTNEVAITAKDAGAYKIGGVVGFNDGRLGGEPANDGKGEITYSQNKANILGSNHNGGIAGGNAGLIRSCSNSGNIDTVIVSGGNGTAGIAGRNGQTNTAVEEGWIIDCFSTGHISRPNTRWNGGITGWNNKLSHIENCYFAGTFPSGTNATTGPYNDQASIVPRYDNFSTYMINNFSVEGLRSTIGSTYTTASTSLDAPTATLAGNGIVLTEAQVKGGELFDSGKTFLEILNGDGGAWAADPGSLNGGLPVLVGVQVAAPEPMVDKTALNAAITSAELLYAADYTAESWTAFADALETAKIICDDDDATQEAVNEALKNLNTAQDVLVPTAGDSSVLSKIIEFLESKVFEEDYTPNSYSPYAVALAEAKTVAADGSATQRVIDAAKASLLAARCALTPRADKESLSDMIALAEKLLQDEDKYIQSAVLAVKDALEGAATVCADPNASQTEVDTACSALMDALVYLLEKGDKGTLETLIKAAEEVFTQADAYTPSTWQVYADALTAARRVLADEEAIQDEVDAAIETLEDAIDGLAPRAVKAALASAITLAEYYLANAASYAPATLVGLAAALDAAKAVYGNAEATQVQVDAVRSALNEKLGQVRAKAKKDALSTAVLSAQALNEADYTPSTWTPFAALLTAAAALIADENATQEAVDAVYASLLGAQSALVKKESGGSGTGNSSASGGGQTSNASASGSVQTSSAASGNGAASVGDTAAGESAAGSGAEVAIGDEKTPAASGGTGTGMKKNGISFDRADDADAGMPLGVWIAILCAIVFAIGFIAYGRRLKKDAEV